MTKVERIKREITELSHKEVRQLTRWLAERDAETWNKHSEEDAKAGRLDVLWKEAKKEIAAGETQPLDDFLDVCGRSTRRRTTGSRRRTISRSRRCASSA